MQITFLIILVAFSTWIAGPMYAWGIAVGMLTGAALAYEIFFK